MPDALASRTAARGLAIAVMLLATVGACSRTPHPSTPVVTAPAAPAPRAPRAPVTAQPPTPASPAPGDSSLQITVQLSAEERDRLTAQAAEDTRLAETRIDQIDAARMTPASSERLEAVRELLAKVAAARARGDLRSAALLARKARILAEDLPRKRTGPR